MPCEPYMVIPSQALSAALVIIGCGFLSNFVLYTWMVVIANRHYRAIAKLQVVPRPQRHIRHSIFSMTSMRSLRMLAAILFIYSLSYLPCVVVHLSIWLSEFPGDSRWHCTYLAATTPVVWNSGINPYFYSICMRDFRQAFNWPWSKPKDNADHKNSKENSRGNTDERSRVSWLNPDIRIPFYIVQELNWWPQ